MFVGGRKKSLNFCNWVAKLVFNSFNAAKKIKNGHDSTTFES
jgi:hypothetical protein